MVRVCQFQMRKYTDEEISKYNEHRGEKKNE